MTPTQSLYRSYSSDAGIGCCCVSCIVGSSLSKLKKVSVDDSSNKLLVIVIVDNGDRKLSLVPLSLIGNTCMVDSVFLGCSMAIKYVLHIHFADKNVVDVDVQ